MKIKEIEISKLKELKEKSKMSSLLLNINLF